MLDGGPQQGKAGVVAHARTPAFPGGSRLHDRWASCFPPARPATYRAGVKWSGVGTAPR